MGQSKDYSMDRCGSENIQTNKLIQHRRSTDQITRQLTSNVFIQLNRNAIDMINGTAVMASVTINA